MKSPMSDQRQPDSFNKTLKKEKGKSTQTLTRIAKPTTETGASSKQVMPPKLSVPAKATPALQRQKTNKEMKDGQTPTVIIRANTYKAKAVDTAPKKPEPVEPDMS